MKFIIDQLEQSLNSPLYYLSLSTAFTVPDIAGAMDSENGEATPSKYATWYDKWVLPLRGSRPDWHIQCVPKTVDISLDGKKCYEFRCSLSHQGRSVLHCMKATRMVFLEPGNSWGRTDGNVVITPDEKVILDIDIVIFCKDIIKGARTWLNKVEGTEPYESNHEKSIKRHPNGLKPYINGIPVIG